MQVTALGKAGSAVAATTLVLTTTAAASVGDLVVVGTGTNGTQTWTCADSVGNTYQAATSHPTAGLGDAMAFFAVLTVNLPAGSTITLTGGSFSYTMIATKFSRPLGATAAVKDVEAGQTNATSTTFTTPATAATTNNHDVAYALFQTPATPQVVTTTGGYLPDPNGDANDTPGFMQLHAQYKELSATGAQTATCTVPTTGTSNAIIVCFKLPDPATLNALKAMKTRS